MDETEATDEYLKWVREIAETAFEMGEPAASAAQMCIVATQNLENEGKVLTFGASPFTTDRRYPSEVLRNDAKYPYDLEAADDLRGLAVERLAAHISSIWDEMEDKPTMVHYQHCHVTFDASCPEEFKDLVEQTLEESEDISTHEYQDKLVISELRPADEAR